MNDRPVRQWLHAMNPRKAPAIKAEIEKILKARFIYPVTFTKWISNPVMVDKKHETIRVCTNFRDLNKACPKYNFPTPFIDQILDECVGSEVFSFIDIFSGYNQIQIKPEDQHKMDFICYWGMSESADLGNTFWQAHFGKKEKTHLGRGFNNPSTEVLSSPRPRFCSALGRGINLV